MSANALREKIVCILPRPGVAIPFRELDPHRGFYYIAALQRGEDLPCSRRDRSITGWLVCDHIQSHTSRHGDHSRDVRSHFFDGIDLEVDRERTHGRRFLVSLFLRPPA